MIRSVIINNRRAKEHLSGYIAGKKPYSAAVVDFMRKEDPTYFQ